MWALFRPQVVEVTLERGQVRLHLVTTERRIEEPALLVRHRETKSVAAAGSDASDWGDNRDYQTIALFCHPRMAIHDFDDSVALLSCLLGRLLNGTRRLAKPTLIFHLPDEKWEGGITDIERRTFVQAGIMAGGGKIFLYDRPAPLKDVQLQEVAMFR